MIRSIALIFVPLLTGAAAPAPDPAYDIVIRGGRVLDGAGNPWVAADVAIADGRIVRVGVVDGAGKQEIDARGRYVSPGFIDMLDQSGRVLLRDGSAASKLRMGVTTLIAGEGGTAVPAGEIAGYFSKLEQQGIAVNFGTYYGAIQARVKVMGDAAGAPNEDQLRAMEGEVRTAMKAGVFGISSALIYSPASFQSTADLARLAAIPGKCGGFYATHMRDESDKLLAAIDEAVTIGERSGAKVEIFHIKAAYAPLWGKLMPQAIARVEAARARGLDIGANIYPYRAGGTGLDVTVPTHVFAKGREAAYAAVRDPAVRKQLKKELAAGPQADWSNLVHASGGWQNVVLANAHNDRYRQFHGKNFAEIGKALGKDPADAAWDIWLAALPARAGALYFLMDDADIDLAMKQPWVSIGTDAAVSDSTADPARAGRPHPRANGTFPRIIADYVRERGVLTLPDAIRKMTGWPAQRLGLADRGLLRQGMRADVVIFDLATIRDRATYEEPTAVPEGIGDVIVNGVVAVAGGQVTGSRSGNVLRHPCPNA
ncbi:N-acyl-D-amino-acid deacylase family protein [Sphingopyxis panaciterrulae]|uniref:N-acyl-D-amino-acid deacylase n=1 Tax=Sphingopyxis panaciterrulae TaxID=462372 RepID=A0A7W9B3K6_9SPHN|nr:amidohydrolase family protein [Sphingopyxis panaciterrulae]MBB5705580.1 N-acyl-D-amino-acid deacylase [Sphingopyxis panaciterrulae]